MIRQNAPQSVFSLNELTGVTGSVTFTLIPTDWNTLVAKLYATTLSGTSPTLDLYIQTQDPQTATFIDVVHFTQLTTSVTEPNAYFAKFGDQKSSALYVGQPKQQNISVGSISGLPLLSRTAKVIYVYGGTVGTANVTLGIEAVDQDYK